jgi:hypothetical protein
MQLEQSLRQVHEQIAATAALADENTQRIASTLASAVGPAVRLAVLDAVTAAADEITAALLDVPGAPRVGVRLDGDELRVDVTTTAPEPAPARAEDGDTSARISLRLSESLKTDVEDAATRDGVSVNTWLVRAATAALHTGWWPGAAAAAFAQGARPAGGARRGNTHHVTGWING